MTKFLLVIPTLLVVGDKKDVVLGIADLKLHLLVMMLRAPLFAYLLFNLSLYQ